MISNGLPRRLTLASDLSSRSDRAFECALLRTQEWKARLLLVHAVEAVQYSFWTRERPSWQRSPDPVEIARAKLVEEYPGWLEVKARLLVEKGDPYELVMNAARETASDLIITGIAQDETY